LPRRRGSFKATLKRDLTQRAAAPVFVFRVVEGLTAWLLFTHTAFGATLDNFGRAAWLLHLVFLFYFAVNTVCYLSYRAGRFRDRLLWLDLLTNFGTLLLVSAHTGGLASPVMVLCFVKIAVYGFVFSPLTGIAAILLTVVAVGGFVAGSELFGLDWVPGRSIGLAEAPGTLTLHFLVVAGALLAATWLFHQVAESEEKTQVEGRRARRAAEREHDAAAVTGALLSVSEAVSRLTRLDDVLNKVVDFAPQILKVDYCAVFLWHEDAGVYRGAAVSGLDDRVANQLLTMRLRPEEVPDLEWVRRLGHCAVISPRTAERIGVTGKPTLLTAPLQSGGRFFGVLQFSRRNGKSFTQSDLRLADGIAGQTAIAIERARLVEHSHRLIRAVDSTDEAVLITDRYRRIVYANPAFTRMFGWSWDELVGQAAPPLRQVFADRWKEELQAVIPDRAWRGETTAQRKDGSSFPISLHASLILAEDQQVEGAVAIIEDITAKTQMQEQLARADRLAAAGELAAGVAHEVNNALAGILGQVDLARDAQDPETLRTSLRRVERQGRRIAEILQDLLGFARPQTPLRDEVQLGELVADTLALLAHDLERHGIQSKVDSLADLPAVLADAKQIQQVLVNLFTNASQAMQGQTGARLVVRGRQEGSMVCLDVEDNGPGIPPELLPRVFDPFVSTKQSGTGLGLSVSYAIAHAHAGDLSVSSVPGVGTIFTLRLPRARRSEGAAPHTLLLVDDDDDVADSLQRMLEREGLQVHRVASGAEAFEALKAADYDAIFLDVRLPDLSGPEIFARLEEQRPDLARRVAFVTGGLWRTDNQSLRERLPPQPLLSKPCTPTQIREVLALLRDLRVAA
jgi:PAS domain S-box-containing protein